MSTLTPHPNPNLPLNTLTLTLSQTLTLTRWVAAFDACGLQLQAEPKRAAELIAEQQRPPTPPTVDAGMGRAPHAQCGP